MNFNIQAFLDGLASRRWIRISCWVVGSIIGLAIANAFWRWSMGATLTPLPLESVLLLLIPQIPQIVDQLSVSAERRSEIHANASMVNPHGGPAAP